METNVIEANAQAIEKARADAPEMISDLKAQRSLIDDRIRMFEQLLGSAPTPAIEPKKRRGRPVGSKSQKANGAEAVGGTA